MVLVTLFSKILSSSRAWTVFIMPFIFLFRIIKVVDEGWSEPCIFLWILASIAEAAAVIPNEATICFARETATFFNGPANLLSNYPTNSPDWIILEISALESFRSVDILLLNTFLSFVFCLIVNNNSWGRSFPSSILKLILRVAPTLFLKGVFSFFNRVSDNLTFTLLYSTTYIFTEPLQFLGKILASFLLIFLKLYILLS